MSDLFNDSHWYLKTDLILKKYRKELWKDIFYDVILQIWFYNHTYDVYIMGYTLNIPDTD